MRAAIEENNDEATVFSSQFESEQECFTISGMQVHLIPIHIFGEHVEPDRKTGALRYHGWRERDEIIIFPVKGKRITAVIQFFPDRSRAVLY